MAEPERPIHLSTNLVDVENEMNEIHERNLLDQRAAKEAEQRKNNLIVYLSHDLRTPWTSVIGYLTLLREEPQLSTDLRACYTNITLEKAERLEQLSYEFLPVMQEKQQLGEQD